MGARSAGAGAPSPGSVFPLRRLGQSEVFAAAFAVIRMSPRATLGLPFIGALLNFFLSLLLALIWPSAAIMQMAGGAGTVTEEQYAAELLSDGWLIGWTVLSTAVSQLLLLVGMALLVIPAMRASLGLRTSLWTAIRLRAGRLGWLVLHIALLVLLATVVAAVALVVALVVSIATLFIGLILVVPALFLLMCWLTAAFMYGPLTILVERRNAFTALGRSWQLNRGIWWRNIGTVALLYLMISIVITVISIPLGVFSGLGESLAWDAADPQNGTWISFAVFAGGQLYGSVLSALTAALIGAIAAMMYLNCRIRQEALDVVLTASDGDELPGSAEHLGRFYASAR